MISKQLVFFKYICSTHYISAVFFFCIQFFWLLALRGFLFFFVWMVSGKEVHVRSCARSNKLHTRFTKRDSRVEWQEGQTEKLEHFRLFFLLCCTAKPLPFSSFGFRNCYINKGRSWGYHKYSLKRRASSFEGSQTSHRWRAFYH